MRLITITGPSGAGKDTVARMMSDMTDWPVLCSYTTRPMREGEVDGREHHFVKECNVPRDKMLAYTRYGGYEYWTTIDQIGDTAIYVIDEVGLKELKERHPDIEVYAIHIFRDTIARLRDGVKLSRLLRDEERAKNAPRIEYNRRIRNVGTLDELRFNIAKLVYTLPFVHPHLAADIAEHQSETTM